jgi:hypothetical protein
MSFNFWTPVKVLFSHNVLGDVNVDEPWAWNTGQNKPEVVQEAKQDVN